MYRFALRGRWLVGHVVVLLLAGIFVRLGLWQLERLDQREARNDRIEARMKAPPTDVEELPVDPDTADHRSAVARGTYDDTSQVRVQLRSYGGQPGDWVLTPLELADGRAVVVNRGWVPQGAPPSSYAPPEGDVEVRGLARRSQVRGRFGPGDEEAGRLEVLNRVDVGRLAQQAPYELLPFYVELAEQTPAVGRLPRPLPPPDLGSGPHLSYALQWFAFAGIGLIGWPLVLRRAAARPRSTRRPAPQSA